MYAFRTPDLHVRERTKAVVLKGLPFPKKEEARPSKASRPLTMRPPSTAPPKTLTQPALKTTTPNQTAVKEKSVANVNPTMKPATQSPMELFPVPKASMRVVNEWAVVGIGNTYYTFYAKRAPGERACNGDWNQLQSLLPDLPQLMTMACPQMGEATRKRTINGYYKLFALLQSMHNDPKFAFHLPRVAADVGETAATSADGVPLYKRPPYALACNQNENGDARRPQSFVLACVRWLLTFEKQMRRFLKHLKHSTSQARLALYATLDKLHLTKSNCLRSSSGFAYEFVLAAQLFFQFIPLYVRPKEAALAARMVRPLPWVVDNVRTVYAPVTQSDKAKNEYWLPQQFDGAAAWYPLQTTPVTTYVLMLPTPLPATQKHVEVPAPPTNALRFASSASSSSSASVCVFAAGRFAGYYVLTTTTHKTVQLMRLGI